MSAEHYFWWTLMLCSLWYAWAADLKAEKASRALVSADDPAARFLADLIHQIDKGRNWVGPDQTFSVTSKNSFEFRGRKFEVQLVEIGQAADAKADA